ncbi:hypothetical protein [Chromobacterium sp. ATCC 53434]|uniref:hypothetical protein n=1 Tax=Chromobacterium sp. (strain ATCC 53434 / SC 14030) TaxID=2059672 RepID=UPI0013050AA1|nr:hypothetical protein [Chromobacterium sp. ATCC 53434]
MKIPFQPDLFKPLPDIYQEAEHRSSEIENNILKSNVIVITDMIKKKQTSNLIKQIITAAQKYN